MARFFQRSCIADPAGEPCARADAGAAQLLKPETKRLQSLIPYSPQKTETFFLTRSCILSKDLADRNPELFDSADYRVGLGGVDNGGFPGFLADREIGVVVAEGRNALDL